MKRTIKNGLIILAAGALAAACADYNTTDNFTAEPDPTFTEPYKDLAPVKSYIDRSQYPNMKMGTSVNLTDFNKQELVHAAAMTNFDDVTFGTALMSGTIVNAKGVMNFLDMMNMLGHAKEIGAEVYGSPLFANANQGDDWLATLTAPIEVAVDYVEGKEVNFNDMPVGNYSGHAEKGKPTIVNYDSQNVLKISQNSSVNIIEGFEVDPAAKYTTTFWARSDKDITFDVIFSGNKVPGNGANQKWPLKTGKWTKFVIESQSAPDVTDGYLRIETARGITIYIQKVQVGYYPDNHRQQTAEEKYDTIQYAINAWCDKLMEINEGYIKTFDLIDEAIDANTEMENGMYDLKHATNKIFWQDILGSEEYAPVVSAAARKSFVEYGGDASQLRFFIGESGLDNEKKLESLMYWIKLWNNKGANITGINAKLSLSYSEDATTQAANVATLNTLLDNLAKTGMIIRLSNFDIKYQSATGSNVTAKEISPEQRQKLADYYAYVIKAYMTKIPSDRQAGICKGNMLDTGDPVGLWALVERDWSRTATYKAFCDALSGK